MIDIQGKCNKNFLAVQDAFYGNFTQWEELGAALTVFYKGKVVVDLWGGRKDEKTNEPWTKSTMVPVFSVTKGLTAFCFLILATHRKIKYDELVSHYWKDFGSNGKETITIRQLLEHCAGLHQLDTKLSVQDFWEKPDKVYEALVNQRPRWVPGTKQAYGAQIWGAYASELFFQITGESAGSFFHREISSKFKLDVYLGLPPEKLGEVATVYPVPTWERITKLIPHFLKGEDSEGRSVRAILKGNSETQKAYLNPWIGSKGLHAFNDPDIQTHELLWANGISNSFSLATLYQSILTGYLGRRMGKSLKVSTRKLVSQLSQPNPMQYDEVIHKNLGWNLGFMKEEAFIFSPHEEAFGHPGMGGSIGFADPKSNLAVGYVCNRMNYRNRPEKTIRLCKAIYGSIGEGF